MYSHNLPPITLLLHSLLLTGTLKCYILWLNLQSKKFPVFFGKNYQTESGPRILSSRNRNIIIVHLLFMIDFYV